MDVEQRARELLAAEYASRGSPRYADEIRDTELADFGDDDIAMAIRAIIAALTPPEGWIAAADRELVAVEIGVAKVDDSTDVAAAKLRELIDWHVSVATDPAVNGGYVLVPVEPTEAMLRAGGWVEPPDAHGQEYIETQGAAQCWKLMMNARPEVKP